MFKSCLSGLETSFKKSSLSLAVRQILTLTTIAAFSLALLEITLRVALDRDKLYDGLESYPELSKIKYESRFLKKHVDVNMAIDSYDPLLGWDFDIQGNRVRGDKSYTPYPESQTLRIITIGDSFTFGNDVGENESYSAFLEQMLPDSEVINMGIPGYGIDQASLKYSRYGSQLHPHIVILGIYIDDYHRSSLSFTAFSKPFFRSNKLGGFDLLNQPVPKPIDELMRIREEAAEEIYSLTLIRNLQRRLSVRMTGQKSQMAKIDNIVCYILRSLRDELNAVATRLLIVQIPDAKEFHKRPSDWYREVSLRLSTIYQKLNIQFIDLSKGFRTLQSDNDIYQNFYIRKKDGSVGHLSPRGNRRTAQLIINALDLDESMMDSTLTSKSTRSAAAPNY